MPLEVPKSPLLMAVVITPTSRVARRMLPFAGGGAFPIVSNGGDERGVAGQRTMIFAVVYFHEELVKLQRNGIFELMNMLTAP
jgi:hypothetical protein